MARENILIVDDEEDILELIKYNLTRNGYKVTCATTGEQAISITKDKPPDLVLLDLMLPGIDGLDVCKMMRACNQTARVPIIMLTAKGEETDIVTGLELGADDYITKPFSPHVLISRVKAVLRRNQKSQDISTPIKIENLQIDQKRHKVFADNQPVELTYTEFSILIFLASHPGWVFTRYQIIDGIKGTDYPVTDRSVDVQVACLRKKLSTYGDYIETVRGIGYRFKEP